MEYNISRFIFFILKNFLNVNMERKKMFKLSIYSLFSVFLCQKIFLLKTTFQAVSTAIFHWTSFIYALLSHSSFYIRLSRLIIHTTRERSTILLFYHLKYHYSYYIMLEIIFISSVDRLISYNIL